MMIEKENISQSTKQTGEGRLRDVDVQLISDAIYKMTTASNYEIPKDVLGALKAAVETEASPVGKIVLGKIIENDEVAKVESLPMCQDTGLAVVFLDIGQDVHLTGGNVIDAVNEGVRKGYKDGYLRKSTCHPFTRANLGDNTPAIVWTTIVPGDKIHIHYAAKGGGSENMSRVMMMKPSDGVEGIKRYVVQRVMESGSNPCPPIIVGIGIGGNFERSAMLAKRALFRDIGSTNPNPEADKLEKELLEMVNKTGVGPAGLGGTTTALGLFIEIEPCHIASLPLAVNVQCHAARHKEAVI